MIHSGNSARTRTAVAVPGSKSPPRARAAARVGPLGILACCMLTAFACGRAVRQTPAPDALPGETTPSVVVDPDGPPAVAPPRSTAAPHEDRAAWVRHSKAGREYLARRENREAEREFVAAMNIAGRYGPATQRQRTSLANLERVAAQYASSPEDLIRITGIILPIASRLRGASDPSVADHSAALGAALIQMDRFDEARAPIDRAMAILRAQQGDESREVALMQLLMAEAERGAGNLGAAEALIRRALEITEGIFGLDDPALLGVLLPLSAVLSESGRAADAERVLQRAHRIAAEVGGTREATVLQAQASLYLETERPAAAEELCLRAVEIIEKGATPRKLAAEILLTLGDSLIAQENWEQAEVYLARAHALDPGTPTPPFDLVRARYAQVLRATGQETEAEAIEAGQSPAAEPAPTPEDTPTPEPVPTPETPPSPWPPLDSTSAPPGDE